MSEVIKNRYEFVILFDVEMVIQTEIRMPGICPVSTRKADTGLLQMYVLKEK